MPLSHPNSSTAPPGEPRWTGASVGYHAGVITTARSAVPARTGRRLAALSLVGMIGLTGCQALSPLETTRDYAPANGELVRSGDVSVMDLHVLATEPQSEGRLLGTVVNSGTEPQEVMLAVDGSEVWASTVEPSQRVNLAEEEITLAEAAAPGAFGPRAKGALLEDLADSQDQETFDAALASTVSTVIVIAGGQSHAEAIAVAVPLAVAGQALTIFVRTVNVFFAHQADAFAEKANFRGITWMHFIALSLQGLRVAIPTAIVAALASGDSVKTALEAIPPTITQGLQIAGGFIVVVGYAMVINMMKARKLLPFFFIGFVFAEFATTLDAGITLVALGILAVCFALIYVQLNPEFQPKPQVAAYAGAPAGVTAGGADLDDDLDDELD